MQLNSELEITDSPLLLEIRPELHKLEYCFKTVIYSVMSIIIYLNFQVLNTKEKISLKCIIIETLIYIYSLFPLFSDLHNYDYSDK